MGAEDTPKITLHWLEKSRSQRILWLLEELGVPYEVKTYKRDPKTMRAAPELKQVHELGKSPVVTVGDRSFAESAFIVEYLCEHFVGPSSTLIPPKWRDGCEGQVNGETEMWLRYRHYMHYCEGSLMTLITMSYIPWSMRQASFFLRPITSRIATKLEDLIESELKTHLDFLESQLASAPDGGPYLCGAHLTGADIMMSFPLLTVQTQDGSPLNKKSYPKLWAYAELLKESESSKRAIAKIVEIEGEYIL